MDREYQEIRLNKPNKRLYLTINKYSDISHILIIYISLKYQNKNIMTI